MRCPNVLHVKSRPEESPLRALPEPCVTTYGIRLSSSTVWSVLLLRSASPKSRAAAPTWPSRIAEFLHMPQVTDRYFPKLGSS